MKKISLILRLIIFAVVTAIIYFIALVIAVEIGTKRIWIERAETYNIVPEPFDMSLTWKVWFPFILIEIIFALIMFTNIKLKD